MKNITTKKLLTIVLLIILSITLSGCKNKGETVDVVEQSSEGENTNINSSETPVDRYKEIINREEDDGKLSIYFQKLSVSNESSDKAGDSTLLISPDGKVMLIDAGHSESARDIMNLLKDLGIEKIDYFVATHPHIDHIGGFLLISQRYEIGMVYRTYLEHTTNTYNNFVNTITENNIPVTYLKEGDEISFGNDINIKVYGPGSEFVYPKESDSKNAQYINDNSLVMKLFYGESSALFSGDIYITRERELIDLYGDELQADVVKANHHGSNTSNSRKWIKNAQAKIVVAMHEEIDSMTVYNNYVKEDADYYLTLLNGYVKIIMDDQKNYTVVPQFDSWMNEDK